MIIQTGLLYYVTVLVELEEDLTGPLLLLMVVVAMLLYPWPTPTGEASTAMFLRC